MDRDIRFQTQAAPAYWRLNGSMRRSGGSRRTRYRHSSRTPARATRSTTTPETINAMPYRTAGASNATRSDPADSWGRAGARSDRRPQVRTFEELDRALFVTLCDAAIAYADPGGRSVTRWFEETVRAVATSPMFVRNFGNHRAHLIATLGRGEAAASVFGSLDRMRADGEHVTSFGDGALRAATIAANPQAYERGYLLTIEQTATLVVRELSRLANVVAKE